jgi:hypothetical protein
MAITHINTDAGYQNTPSSSVSMTHNPGTGGNFHLVLVFGQGPLVSNITYDYKNMTRLMDINYSSVVQVSVWYIHDLGTGDKVVTANLSNSANSQIITATYAGVGRIGDTDSGYGVLSSTGSLILDTQAGDLVFYGFYVGSVGSGVAEVTWGEDQTHRIRTSGSGLNWEMETCDKLATTTSTTVSGTVSQQNYDGLIGIVMKEGNPQFFQLF